MSARPKTNIRVKGREDANADEMSADVRAAYDRAVDETAQLHSGARLAAKLNAKIIVKGNEFNNAGEMSVDDRHLYHEALEALFPPDIAVSPREPAKTNGEKRSLIMSAVKRRLSQSARGFGWRLTQPPYNFRVKRLLA